MEEIKQFNDRAKDERPKEINAKYIGDNPRLQNSLGYSWSDTWQGLVYQPAKFDKKGKLIDIEPTADNTHIVYESSLKEIKADV